MKNKKEVLIPELGEIYKMSIVCHNNGQLYETIKFFKVVSVPDLNMNQWTNKIILKSICIRDNKKYTIEDTTIILGLNLDEFPVIEKTNSWRIFRLQQQDTSKVSFMPPFTDIEMVVFTPHKFQNGEFIPIDIV